MAKPELGTKRVCASCGAKFYDLARDPIACPKCGAIYVVTTVAARGAPRPGPAAAPVVAEEPELPQPVEAEVISLEEADAEATGKKPAVPDVDVEVEAEDDVEVPAADDDTFLEEEEEEPGNVSDIIGEKVEDDDET